MNQRQIKNLPFESRPYERCSIYGPEALTDAELLAVILRTGTKGLNSIELANRVLSFAGSETGILGILHHTTAELRQIPGIGEVKAIQLKCVMELSKRISKQSFQSTINFTDPSTIASYYMEEFRHKECEELHAFFLNSKHALLKQVCLFRGTVNESFAAPRELFIEACRYRAVAFCLLHNHPSGDPSPSNADILSTRRIMEAGSLIGITLLDHIIIGDQKYCSLRERGVIS